MDADGGGKGHGSILPGSAPPPRWGLVSSMPLWPTLAGLTLPPPRRNFSPWYQWMARLGATVHEDPLPEGDDGSAPDAVALNGWLDRTRIRLADLLGREPQAVPLDTETLESVACAGYTRQPFTPAEAPAGAGNAFTTVCYNQPADLPGLPPSAANCPGS